MRRRPPRSKRTDTHFPDTTFFRSLEEEGLAARALTLVCLRVDGAEQRLSIGTARATRDAAHLTRLFAMKIETIEPGFGIEAMRLVAIRCEPLGPVSIRSEEHTSELQSLMRISYAVFCLKKKKKK